ncbi:MAG: YdiU family protein [Notoacmeibacter sp.]|nr:YdiU family protein [Notoacmeibacter sp.]
MNAPQPGNGLIGFDNSYARLPARFFARLDPTPVKAPRLIRLNEPLARELGIDGGWLASAEGIEVLAGNRIAAGSQPLAQAYAGHQFGGWVPQLGDGRAILLGEIVDAAGRRRDIQLKGSGRTPFSRSGDGRAWLGPVLREYVVSEAMAALGVPTTRALAAVETGEAVMREQVLPGAVLTRVAASHVRVGTFQYFAARGDLEALKLLADHVIERHYPEAAGADNAYLALLEGVAARQAALIAQWMGLGFIHGVMNTDNMSVAGETIDYGPCAFMDAYHPDTVFSSIDQWGRYAFKNQPAIAQWNLANFASCLVPLIDDDQEKAVEGAQAAVDAFMKRYEEAQAAILRAKIGLGVAHEADEALVGDLLSRMAEESADYSLVFRRLSALPQAGGPETDGAVRTLFADPSAFDGWAVDWRRRLESEGRSDEERQAAMRAVNPAYIPRNHRVEAVIQAALAGDYAPFEELNAVLAHPYDDQPQYAAYQQPPEPDEVVKATFCGT